MKNILSNADKLKVLKDIVGNELFKVITEQLNGENIYFSNYGAYHSKRERDEAIKADFFGGMSQQELADKYDLTITSIYKIVENRQ